MWVSLVIVWFLGSLAASIRLARIKVAVSDLMLWVLFPVRTLLNKLIPCRPSWLNTVTTVRRRGKVSVFGVIWPYVAVILLIFCLLSAKGLLPGFDSLAEKVYSVSISEGELDLAGAVARFRVDILWVVLLFFYFLVATDLVAFGTSTRTVCRVSKADVEDFHQHEQAIASASAERIRPLQDMLADLGLRWKLEVKCINRLDDVRNETATGRFAALMGGQQSNPFYISRIEAQLLDDLDMAAPVPFDPDTFVEICYTNSRKVYRFHDERVIDRLEDILTDATDNVMAKVREAMARMKG